jgi:2-polyprenyl-3-methyl-5-hydroxy-6-metoxy-1,4-benzoquinol methylase
LAARGYHVTGVDVASTAIDRAREKSRERGLDVDFTVADVTILDGFDNRFDTVIDSGLYDCLTHEQRHVYLATLYRACRPGATLHLFCVPDDELMASQIPHPVSEYNLRATVGRQWTITRLEKKTACTTAFTAEFARQADQLPSDLREVLANARQDERGRLMTPVWQLTAHRVS